MITLLSATNRKDSNTLRVATEYGRMLELLQLPHQLITLEHLPAALLGNDIYETPDPAWATWQQEHLFSSEKFIFIIPEYNGSIPGILKLMLDAADIEKAFYYKKALLVGVATGRVGNLRGIDHLAAILRHMKMEVHWNHLPISRVTAELDTEGHFFQPSTVKAVTKQLEHFAEF